MTETEPFVTGGVVNPPIDFKPEVGEEFLPWRMLTTRSTTP